MILEATIISLKVVIIAVVITLIISLIVLNRALKYKSRAFKLVETFIILPLFIPPSAIGYLILTVFGKRGVIGRFLDGFGIQIIFTITAAIIAAVVVTLPIMYQNIKAAALSVDKDIISAAKICGASNLIIFIKIILPLSYRGLLNGLLLSFARAFGEFGATILVAGNIPGKTQTLPMAMYYSIENNNSIESMKILIIILVLAISLMTLYSILEKKDN